jgi:hypothetical protein
VAQRRRGRWSCPLRNRGRGHSHWGAFGPRNTCVPCAARCDRAGWARRGQPPRIHA